MTAPIKLNESRMARDPALDQTPKKRRASDTIGHLGRIRVRSRVVELVSDGRCEFHTPPRSRDIMRPSLQIRSPQKEEGAGDPQREGAGKTGCALHPRSRVQGSKQKTHTSIQVQRKQSGLPCAMALRLISRSPRRDLACLSPSPPRSVSFSRT